MIDTKKPFRFFDDRGKTKVYVYPVKILWEDESACLCAVGWRGGFEYMLFTKENHEVMSTNFEFWMAENYKLLRNGQKTNSK